MTNPAVGIGTVVVRVRTPAAFAYNMWLLDADDSRLAVGTKLISAGDSTAAHIMSVENKEGQRTLRCVVRRRARR